MEKIVVNGGTPLRGSVEISGMKNAALPIIYASILVRDKCVIENIPNVSDVSHSLDLLRAMGATIRTVGKNAVEIDCTDIRQGSAPYELARKMRASYYLFGAELGRFHTAHAPLPGGCEAPHESSPPVRFRSWAPQYPWYPGWRCRLRSPDGD